MNDCVNYDNGISFYCIRISLTLEEKHTPTKIAEHPLFSKVLEGITLNILVLISPQSFSEMMEAIEQADGHSCDVWVKETVNLDSSGNYGNMTNTKRVLFPLAKLQDPGQAGNMRFPSI